MTEKQKQKISEMKKSMNKMAEVKKERDKLLEEKEELIEAKQKYYTKTSELSDRVKKLLVSP